MQLLKEIKATNQFIQNLKLQSKRIGLVPTMGALHQGHLSLIEACKKENDITVCSIFVNPTQFNNQEDFDKYPNQLADDLQLLNNVGCNLVFAPLLENMYPNFQSKTFLKMDFGSLSQELEGKYRSGHFNGVGIVVAKLLHIVSPDAAYFGQKDLQQLLIIKKLVQDLSFMTEIKSCPTVREEDGLAMSSRNIRLNKIERESASLLFKVLKAGESAIKENIPVERIRKEAFETIAANPLFTPEYAEVVDINSFDIIHAGIVKNEVAICIAAHLGKVRLIDNIIVSP